jgi:cell wall-associated NlpC family hydrolase
MPGIQRPSRSARVIIGSLVLAVALLLPGAPASVSAEQVAAASLALPAGAPAVNAGCDPASLTADLALRDDLASTTVERAQWYTRNWNDGWGPRAATYPSADVPLACDAVPWQRARVVAVARRYVGLSYRHHHVPDWAPTAGFTDPANAGPGLDCSNFSAWVYNYGLGLRLTSNIGQQADGPAAPGRVLAPDEPYAPGDLLFILKGDRSRISHVVIYTDNGQVIDSHGAYGGVTEHPIQGWYATHLSHARRLLE